MRPIVGILLLFPFITSVRDTHAQKRATPDGDAPLRGFVREKIEKKDADKNVARTLEKSNGAGSVRALMPRALKTAKQWSLDAVLYSILGHFPRNEQMLEPEEWTFIFGDPKRRDGRFKITLKDEALSLREGIKDSIQMTEYFKDGEFLNRKSRRITYGGMDYKDCAPISGEFLDTPAVEEIIRGQKFPTGMRNQYRLALLAPRNDSCEGLGHLSQFLTEKPFPEEARGGAFWVATNLKENLFIDAYTGAILLRRPRLATPQH